MNNIRTADISIRNKRLAIKQRYFLIIGLLLTIISLLIGIILYDDLPSNVIMQWKLTDFGESFRTVDKSRGLIYILPLTQLLMMFLMVFTNIIGVKSKIELQGEKSEELKEIRDKIIRKRFLVSKMLILVFIFVQLTFLIMQLTIFTQNIYWIIAFLVLVIIMLSLMAYFATKIKKIKYPRSSGGWKNNAIYSNKKDSAMFVEKKWGIGYTINFSNKLAVALFIGMILVLVGLLIILSTVGVIVFGIFVVAT